MWIYKLCHYFARLIRPRWFNSYYSKSIRETDEKNATCINLYSKWKPLSIMWQLWQWGCCIFFPWAGKLSWAPVLTSNGLISEDEELEQMQMNVLKGLVSADDANPVYQLCSLVIPCLPDNENSQSIWLRAPSLWKYQRHLIFLFVSFYR